MAPYTTLLYFRGGYNNGSAKRDHGSNIGTGWRVIVNTGRSFIFSKKGAPLKVEPGVKRVCDKL
jgi:hypothetical protein